jgi:nitrogen regulatory protein P-II 1
MREVKAYFRRTQVDAIVHALRAAGVPHMTVTHVQSLGSGVDPQASRVSMEAGMPYLEHAKLEFVCPAAEVERLVAVLRAEARTGEPGDGIIFVSPVDRAVKILTGVEGVRAVW